MSTASYADIYDYFYTNRFPKEFKDYNPTTQDKNSIMLEIFKDHFEIEDNIRNYMHNIRYSNINAWKKTKGTTDEVAKKERRAIMKKFDSTSNKFMYNPNNIRLAIPNFYKTEYNAEHLLKIEDFGNKKYILTALHKSSIYTREELLAHLRYGYTLLFTIPGCGQGAIQNILHAMDVWAGRI